MALIWSDKVTERILAATGLTSGTTVGVYKGTMPTENDMDQQNSPWIAARSSDLLLEWTGVAFKIRNSSGDEDTQTGTRLRIFTIPDAITATSSGTASWGVLRGFTSQPSIVGPVSLTGGDGLITLETLTITTSGSPVPEYELLDAGFKFDSVAS